MAVQVIANTILEENYAASHTISAFNSAGEDTLLLVGSFDRNPNGGNVAGITADGASMTEQVENINTNVCGIEVYSRLTNDSSVDIVSSTPGFRQAGLAAISLQGVNQSTPIAGTQGTASGFTTAATTSYTGKSGNLLVVFVTSQGDTSMTASGCTQLINQANAYADIGGQFVGVVEATGVAQTVGATLGSADNFRLVVVEVNRADRDAITYSAQNSAAGNSMTLPTHAAGDGLVMFAFRNGSTTAPTVPAGWESIGVNTGTLTAGVAAIKKANSSSETSGTWTNADGLICLVYDGIFQSGTFAIRHAGNQGTTNTVNYSGITTMQDAGNSWSIRFAAYATTDTSLETAPSGFTNRSNLVGGAWEMAAHDTNGTTGSVAFGGVSVGGTNGNWITQTIELLVDYSPAGLDSKAGQLTGPTTTGAVAYNAPLLQPKGLLLFNGVQTANGAVAHSQMSVGVGARTTSEFSAGYNDNDADGTVSSTRFTNTSAIVGNRTTNGTGAHLIADLSALSRDGFSLNWSTLGTTSPLVNYMAIGGEHITHAASGNYAMNTGTGNQSVTGVGFSPDVVIFIATLQTTSAAAANATQFSFGAMDKNGNEWSICQKQQNGGAASNTNRSFSDQAHLSFTQTAADNFAHKQSFVSMDSDGFTVNIDTAVGLACLVGWMAFKGGSWKVGTDTQKTSTGTKPTTGVGFTPSGVIFGSVCDTTTDAVSTHARFALGGTSGASNNVAIWTGDTDAADPTTCDTIMSNTKCLVLATEAGAGGATTNAQANLSTFDSDGFTLDWTTADATARRFGYIAFGDNYIPPAGGTNDRMLLLGVG